MPPIVKHGGQITGLSDRVTRLQQLLGMVAPVPQEWLSESPGARTGSTTVGGVLSPKPCTEYSRVVKAWAEALHWTDGLDRALAVMLAASMSTRLVGEQLWVKVLGPPSSGKTTLLEGLSVSRKYVFSKDTIRGFYSGWIDKQGNDLSVAALARGKTLATKDGDTLLKAPNLQQILSEGRGLYDRVGRTHYRNAVTTDYEGHRMTWLLCGTNALREIDESELGARFIDCVIMDDIDDDFEDEVTWRAVQQEADAMLVESDGDPRGHYPPDLAHAMELTGGYLEYLRENVTELVSQVYMTPEVLRQCKRFGRFISYMRARPGRREGEDAREFAARLGKQMVRLARSLGATLNKREVDVDVMERVRRVAMDTSRGDTLKLLRRLYDVPQGMEVRGISIYLNRSDEQIRRTLRFLRSLGVVVQNKDNTRRWMLTRKIGRLYSKVKG